MQRYGILYKGGRAGREAVHALVCSHPSRSLARAVIGVLTLAARPMVATPYARVNVSPQPRPTRRGSIVEGFEMAGKAAERLEVVHPDCAGIDVGKRKHYVAVDASRFEDPVRHFGSFTRDLEAMAEWLLGCGVAQVAMESTGVYWIPVFEVLERAGLEVHLVNPRATKQVSGRKSDVLDCQWIRQLMSYGLLRGRSGRPTRCVRCVRMCASVASSSATAAARCSTCKRR